MLVEGDDTNEPVADNVRAILDGHIVLSRDLGAAQPLSGHRRAARASAARCPTSPPSTTALKAGTVRDWMATLRDSEDLVSVGAYVAGSNPRIDEALAKRGAIDDFLRQPADDLVSLDDAARRRSRRCESGSCRRRRGGVGPPPLRADPGKSAEIPRHRACEPAAPKPALRLAPAKAGRRAGSRCSDTSRGPR